MSVKVTYNKLVRDRMPQVVERNGDTATFRTLDHDEYVTALTTKLTEEVIEFNRHPCVEEMADIIEVLQCLVPLCWGWSAVRSKVESKRVRRGSLLSGLMMVDCTYPDGHRKIGEAEEAGYAVETEESDADK